MKVFKVFEVEQALEIRKSLESMQWEDGKKTARGSAADIKNNEQITSSNADFRKIAELVSAKIQEKKSILYSYAMPKAVVGIRANRYREGQTYGWHVDMPHMEKLRTDLSFTLFLSDKSTYEGGDLEISHDQFKMRAKGHPGEMVVYPTGLLHQVTPVTNGARVCIVGWINSFVPNDDCRDALFALKVNYTKIKKELGNREELDQINYAYLQLLRHLSN